MSEDKICKNCFYYENKNYDLSYCHRYPAVDAKHEMIRFDDWCGEFVSRRIIEISEARKLNRRNE